jgi:hypothetical protein
MTTTTTRTRRALCEWCHERPGDYDMSPPDVEYATMICYQCFARKFVEIGKGRDTKLWECVEEDKELK